VRALFKPYVYPSLLEPLRTQVIETLSQSDNHDECRKIARCKGSFFQCGSVYCPSCLRGDSYHLKNRIVCACDHARYKRNLKFARFKCVDVPLDALRETSGTLMRTSRQMFKRLGVPGHITQLEVSFEGWRDLYHPHIHSLIDTPPGGRRFISPSAYEQEWLEALPDHLHPRENAGHIETVRDLDAVCTYTAKSPFRSWIEDRARVARTVAVIRETKGLQQTYFRGSLQPADDAVAA
jgi:hypothetical protein